MSADNQTQLPIPSDFVTLGDFLEWASDYFEQNQLYFGHGTDNAWDEAVMLALYVLQLGAENDRSVLQKELTSNQQNQLFNLAIQRVQERIPVPYLTHEAWFAGERYYVTRDVLIPRSPIAELILNNFQPWLGNLEPKNILDLCTGSGCLAILTAKQFSGAHVDAVDISDAALEVAEKNIKLHNCESQVRAIKSDLFAELNGKRYDIIISNPPYVGSDEMQNLPQEYTHEPELALASGEDGLDLTIQILRNASKHLQEDGLLVVEVGNSWHLLEEKYPNIPFTWIEFAHGGEGVFVLTAEHLRSIKL